MPDHDAHLLAAATALVSQACTNHLIRPDRNGILRALRCGSRLVAVCPGCAAQVHGDYTRIMRSGLFDLGGDFLFFLLTLTAGSFGPVHRVAKEPGHVTRCHCGRKHDAVEDADLRGIPIDICTYRYADAIDFNASLGTLWNATRTALVKRFPELAYAAVVEDQARGASHLHVFVRLPARVATESTSALITRVAAKASARSPATKRVQRWGAQIDCRRIAPDADLGRTVSYLTKATGYLLKDVADSGGGRSERQEAHWSALRAAALAYRCEKCQKKESWTIPSMLFCASHDPRQPGTTGSPEGLALRRLPSGTWIDPASGLLLAHDTGEVVGDTSDCLACAGARHRDFLERTRCDRALHWRHGRRMQTVLISRGSKNRPGWSVGGLTRNKLKQERIAWAEQQSIGQDPDTAAQQSLQRAESLRGLRAFVDVRQRKAEAGLPFDPGEHAA